jgi:murein L,D-transpeptidase YcbB/YkuD
MEWAIIITVALVVYVFVVRRRGRAALADAAAHGGAGGARHATYGYFRRRDLIWQVAAVLAGLVLFWMVFFGDDDTSAPATETASATETTETAPATETISSPLSFGDSGPDVVILQERLDAEGLPVTVDGAYGQETADAVMAFQEQEQLSVDGVVGSETAEALGVWSG